MKTLARSVYHLVPETARRRLEASPLVGRIHERIASDPRLHDAIYDAAYYDSQLAWLETSAATFGRDLLDKLAPRSAWDVGCGQGCYLAVLHKAGVKARGIELADVAFRRCVERGLPVEQRDLTKLETLPTRADLVYSTEVAEHLPERFADGFVRLLTGAADRHVVITAAAPGQTGKNHFNCQPKSYWTAKFIAEGFVPEHELTEAWEADNRARRLPEWLCHNLMVFRRAA